MSIYKLHASVPGPYEVKEPVFPCWLYSIFDRRWVHRTFGLIGDVECMFDFTHGSPSPTMPQGVPETGESLGQIMDSRKSGVPTEPKTLADVFAAPQPPAPFNQTPPGLQVDAQRIAGEIARVWYPAIGEARYDGLAALIAARIAPLVEELSSSASRYNNLHVDYVDARQELAQLRADLAAAKEEMDTLEQKYRELEGVCAHGEAMHRNTLAALDTARREAEEARESGKREWTEAIVQLGEKQAECAALCQQLAAVQKERDEIAKTADARYRELRRLAEAHEEQQLAAAAAPQGGEDAKRLDWLALRCFRKPGPASVQSVYAIIDSSVWPARACTPQEKPDMLRAAIDAAIQQEGKQP